MAPLPVLLQSTDGVHDLAGLVGAAHAWMAQLRLFWVVNSHHQPKLTQNETCFSKRLLIFCRSNWPGRSPIGDSRKVAIVVRALRATWHRLLFGDCV
jgi:hypothetical protein